MLGPLVVVVAIFCDALFSGRVFFDRDIQGYWYPQVATFVRIVGEGTWPVWDPYEGFGLPLLADPTSQIGYPLTWLNLILFPAAVYKVLLIGHVLASGVGLSMLGRRWGMSRLAASLAGVAWCASGPLLSAGSLPQHICGAAWMPWVLFTLERALRSPDSRAAASLGAVAGTQVLAGSAEMCLFTSMMGLGRFAFWLWAGESRGSRAAALRVLVAAAALALCLSGVLWLPVSLLLGSISAGHLPPERGLFWSLHPLSLLDLFVPRFFTELPLSAARREMLFDGREPYLASLYLGLPSAAAATLALGGRRLCAYASTMALVFGVLALGSHASLARIVLGWPLLNLFRYPVKYAIPFAMFWALLVGFGLDRWRSTWARRDTVRATLAALALATAAAIAGLACLWVRCDAGPAIRVLDIPEEFSALASHLLARKLGYTAVIAASAAALLARRLRGQPRPRLVHGLALLAAIDLAAQGRGVNPLAPAELLERRPPTLGWLGPDIAHGRLLASTGSIVWLNRHFLRRVEGWDERASWSLGLQDLMFAPSAARWRIRGSYDGDFIGLATPAQSYLTGALMSSRSSRVTTKLLRLGNVGYVVALEPDVFPDLLEVGRLSSVFDLPVRVLKVKDPLPPAWVVGGARVAGSPYDAVLMMGDDSFDPAREVVLSGASSGLSTPPVFRGRCTILERRADRMLMEVEASAPAQVVVAEAYQQGWVASVDGAPAAVVPGNLLFRAVAVPAGRHSVELRYRPPGALVGVTLSLAGLGAMVVLLWRRAGTGQPAD